MLVDRDWYAAPAGAAVRALESGDARAIQRADIHVVSTLFKNLMRGFQGARELDREDPFHFMLHMGRLARLSPSQLFQDLFALWETGEKRNGYFVEFGAMDGRGLSNTWLLEHHFDWTGIVAEPNPQFAEAIRRNRSCYVSTDCVYSRSGETVDFRVVSDQALSRIASINPFDANEQRGGRSRFSDVRVPTISLHDLLMAAGAPDIIDYLSIDTEGSEFEILRPLDFERWRFRVITVEHNKTPARQQIFELLSAHGYRRKWTFLSGVDDWYVLEV